MENRIRKRIQEESWDNITRRSVAIALGTILYIKDPQAVVRDHEFPASIMKWLSAVLSVWHYVTFIEYKQQFSISNE